MEFPIRSPREQVSGIFVFGRILDKIRLQACEGKLPDGYHLGVISGKRTFDDRVCRFLGVEFADLSTRTLAGGSDEEILAWCFETGDRPDDEQIVIWNGFMSKRDNDSIARTRSAGNFSSFSESVAKRATSSGIPALKNI